HKEDMVLEAVLTTMSIVRRAATETAATDKARATMVPVRRVVVMARVAVAATKASTVLWIAERLSIAITKALTPAIITATDKKIKETAHLHHVTMMISNRAAAAATAIWIANNLK